MRLPRRSVIMPETISASDHLARLRRDAEEVTERVRAAVEGLSPDQLTWRPPEGGWSVVECLEHLSMTNEMYADAADRVLAEAPQIHPSRAPDFRPGVICARFIRMFQPGRGRYPAPKPFRPDVARPVGVGAVERFFSVHARTSDVIARMAHVDLTHTKIASPLSSLIRFRMGDMMDFLLVHSKRHVLQAERVILHADFPSPGRGGMLPDGSVLESAVGPAVESAEASEGAPVVESKGIPMDQHSDGED
jgi:DinB superfamily